MAKAVEVTATTGGPLPARAANSADFSLPAADDVHLLAEVKLGDARCLAALFDRYGDDCIRVAHRLHPDARIAENVVFNAFMQLWRTPPDQPHSLKDWLLLRSDSLTWSRDLDRSELLPVEAMGDLPRPASGNRQLARGLAMVRSDENMNLQELQTLLEHARVLGQAAGILMERFSVDAAQAFDEIADAAGRSGKTANAVARALTSTRHWERATG